MNIAYVLADFPVFSETFVGDEMRAMERLQHKLLPIVMQPRKEVGQPADQPLAERALRLHAVKGSAHVIRQMVGAGAGQALAFLAAQKCLLKRSLLWNACKIAKLVREAGCMHLHAHFCGGAAAHAIVAARLANASVSFICHGHDVYSEPEDLALKLNAADFVIATCADMASDLRAMAPKANIVVSYCGIDPSRFHPRTVESNGRLLFVGRLVEQKGVDDILRALALMDGVARPALDIVGTGPQKAALESLAESLGLLDKYVRFLGPQPRSWFSENGPDYLALVSPFKTGPNGERDSGPMVIKEAMGLGLPVISSRYMGVKEMILPGMGLLIEPGNVPELARALDTARAWSTTERAAITAKALDRLRTTFTLEKQAQDLTNCIQSVQARIRKKKFSNDKL